MLDPIESDEDMARDYIPLPGGWELQTKGTGSTMRLLDRKTGDRFGLPLPDFAIKKIERMAYEIHAACTPDEDATIVHQIRDFTEGIGSSEDHDDIRAAFKSLGMPEDLVETVMRRIVGVAFSNREIDEVLEAELGSHYWRHSGTEQDRLRKAVRQVMAKATLAAGDARRHVICVCPDCTKPRSGWQLVTIDHAPGLDDLVHVSPLAGDPK